MKKTNKNKIYELSKSLIESLKPHKCEKRTVLNASMRNQGREIFNDSAGKKLGE